MMSLLRRLILLGFLGSASVSYAAVEVAMWHSFSGHLGLVFDNLCQQFNHSQRDYRIKSHYKGNYTEALTSFAAAFRAGKAPPIMQVFEVGSATMLYPKGIIKPLHRVLKDHGVTIDQADFLPAIRHYYSDEKGRLQALPFNSSVPLLYYNKTQFRQAGIDENEAPTTWQQVGRIAKRLQKAGRACAYTTAYPSWIHLESFSALHQLDFESKGQTLLKRRVNFNNKAFERHLSRLVKWEEDRVFQYGGRDSDAQALFTSGHCAMMTQSSGSYQSLKQLVSFDLGVASMPYDSSIQKERGNAIIGGAALWVVEGFDDKTYKGVAKFLQFLSTPLSQAHWQQETGYLPISKQALKLVLPKGDEALALAYEELNHQNADYPRIRLGAYAQIRIINDEEIEAAIAKTKTPHQALADATMRVNHLLNRFEKNVS